MPWVTRCSYCDGGTLYAAVGVYVNGALIRTINKREDRRTR